jgi:hypothetical protein
MPFKSSAMFRFYGFLFLRNTHKAVKMVSEATSAKKKDVYALALRLFGK